MKKHLSRGLTAAVCASALLSAAAPAPAATVTIRVEGDARTIVQQTTVTTAPGVVNKDGDPEHDCDAVRAIGALEQSTGGNWNGPWFDGLGYAPERILDETHDASTETYWGIFFNKAFASEGLCAQVVQDGDEILLYPACYGSGCTDPRPLEVTAPQVVQAREAFTVLVERLADSGARSAAEGATVTVAGRSAVTGPDGRATITVDAPGDADVAASAPNSIRDTGNRVCVHDGNDGRCGFPRPDGTPTSGSGAPAAGDAAAPGGARDRSAPLAVIGAIRDGQVFARGAAPRLLSGSAGEPATPRAATPLRPDSSGLLMVKLRLTRQAGGRCSTYSGSRERFVRRPCGASRGFWFRIGDRADWEYQLASRLPRGRYVLDVNAIDKAYNRDDARQRGRNRVIFRVR